jgi:hypothetical protein
MDPSDAGARIGRPGASSAQLPNLRLMLGFDHGEFFVNTRSKKHGGIAGYIIFTVQKLPPLEEHPWLATTARRVRGGLHWLLPAVVVTCACWSLVFSLLPCVLLSL